MRILGIEVSRFRSIRNLKCGFDPSVNVLVGRNNAGKTTIISAMRLLFGTKAQGSRSGESGLSLSRDDWYRLSSGEPIILSASIQADEGDVSPLSKIVRRLSSDVKRVATRQLSKLTEPAVDALERLKNGTPEERTVELTREVLLEADGSVTSRLSRIAVCSSLLFTTELRQMHAREPSTTTPAGRRRYITTENPLIAFEKGLETLLNSKFRFIAPTRRRTTELPRREGALDMLNRLYDFHTQPGASPHYRRFLQEVQTLPFSEGNVRPSREDIRDERFVQLVVEVSDRLALPVRLFGEGLRAAINMVYEVVFSDASIIALEEPENSLHPAGQVEVFEVLRGIGEEFEKQLFISTHSPVLVDLAQDLGLFLVSKDKRGTRTARITSGEGVMDAFKSLGVKPSHAVLASGVVWVEGPSDVSLVRRWLEVGGADPEAYSVGILPYGGSNLDHITASDFYRLNPNFILIMDSERRVPKGHPRGYRKKNELKKACEKRGNHAWITKKRALDNYVPSRVIREVYGLRDFTMERYQSLEEQVRERAEAENVEARYRKTRDTPKFASRITMADVQAISELHREVRKMAEKVRLWKR